MATNTAPLLSFGASGQIAKTQVYAKWRGIPYTRRYVVPANPNTSAQQSTRSIFTFMSNVWKNASSLYQAPWTAYSTGQPFYNRNAFIGQNVKALRAGTTLANMIFSPGAKGGVAPLSISVTGAAGALTVAFTNPTPPTGWTIAAAVAVAIKAGDPHTATTFASFAAEDDTTFDSVHITGLSAGAYEVGAWLVWTKPDGTAAYSVSINGTGTAT